MQKVFIGTGSKYEGRETMIVKCDNGRCLHLFGSKCELKEIILNEFGECSSSKYEPNEDDD